MIEIFKSKRKRILLVIYKTDVKLYSNQFNTFSQIYCKIRKYEYATTKKELIANLYFACISIDTVSKKITKNANQIKSNVDNQSIIYHFCRKKTIKQK